MNIFELLEPTKVKFTEVEILSSKNRQPNENPGAALSVLITGGNDMLSMLDPFLKGTLYTAVPKTEKVPVPDAQAQGDMMPADISNNPQIVSDMPKLTEIAKRLGEFDWDLEIMGASLFIEYGATGPQPLDFGGCKVYKFRVFPQEGGSVIFKFRIEFNDVTSQQHGKLAMLKSCESVIRLEPPVAAEENPLPFNEDGSSNVEPKTPGEAALKSRRTNKKA